MKYLLSFYCDLNVICFYGDCQAAAACHIVVVNNY